MLTRINLLNVIIADVTVLVKKKNRCVSPVDSSIYNITSLLTLNSNTYHVYDTKIRSTLNLSGLRKISNLEKYFTNILSTLATFCLILFLPRRGNLIDFGNTIFFCILYYLATLSQGNRIKLFSRYKTRIEYTKIDTITFYIQTDIYRLNNKFCFEWMTLFFKPLKPDFDIRNIALVVGVGFLLQDRKSRCLLIYLTHDVF